MLWPQAAVPPVSRDRHSPDKHLHRRCKGVHRLYDIIMSLVYITDPGGRLPNILPGCVGWGFSNLPIVVHTKNEEDRPIMVFSRQ